eukprot:5798703-Amphidinium_carterae.1
MESGAAATNGYPSSKTSNNTPNDFEGFTTRLKIHCASKAEAMPCDTTASRATLEKETSELY